MKVELPSRNERRKERRLAIQSAKNNNKETALIGALKHQISFTNAGALLAGYIAREDKRKAKTQVKIALRKKKVVQATPEQVQEAAATTVVEHKAAMDELQVKGD